MNFSLLHGLFNKNFNSQGSWEFWREDANLFPAEVLGNDYEDWPGEKWLDVRNMAAILPIMRERFRAAADKGCKGIAADKMIAWEYNNTGFDITPQDQLVYNRIIAAEIQVVGLMSGLVTDVRQASELVHQYDFGVIMVTIWAKSKYCCNL